MPVLARHTTRSDFPSLSMSAMCGTSPRLALPHCLPPCWAKLYDVDDVSQCHVPSVGRQTTRSTRLSPSMSAPLRMTSPCARLPHWMPPATELVALVAEDADQ